MDTAEKLKNKLIMEKHRAKSEARNRSKREKGGRIMGVIATGGNGEEPIPAGTYKAVCYAVVDTGTPQEGGKYPPKRQFVVLWEIPTERMEYESEDVPRVVSRTFNNTTHEQGKLRPFLETWRGQAFTSEEIDEFDMKNIIRANCLLQITYKPNSTWPDPSSVFPLPKDQQKLKPEKPTVPQWLGGVNPALCPQCKSAITKTLLFCTLSTPQVIKVVTSHNDYRLYIR